VTRGISANVLGAIKNLMMKSALRGPGDLKIVQRCQHGPALMAATCLSKPCRGVRKGARVQRRVWWMMMRGQLIRNLLTSLLKGRRDLRDIAPGRYKYRNKSTEGEITTISSADEEDNKGQRLDS